MNTTCPKCGEPYGEDTAHFCESVSGKEPVFKYDPQVGLAASRSTGTDAEILAELKRLKIYSSIFWKLGINLNEVNDG